MRYELYSRKNKIMLDIDALMNNSGKDNYKEYKFSPKDIESGLFISKLADRHVSSKCYNRAIAHIYKNNIIDVELFSAIMKNSNLSDNSNPLSSLIRDIHRYYANGSLDIKPFNTKVSKLEPSVFITKQLVNYVWSDFDLTVKLTESENIDKYNPPEVILLSVLKWWPDLASELGKYSTLFKDSELIPVFNDKVSNLPRVKDKLDINSLLEI